jgi:hypothetical protein
VFKRLGDHPRARAAAELAQALTAPHDLLNLVLIDIARACLALRDGDHSLAERLARDGVEHAERTELPFLQGIAHLELGRLLRAVGSDEQSRWAAMDALRLFRARDDRPRIAQARELLGRLGLADPAVASRARGRSDRRHSAVDRQDRAGDVGRGR